MWSVTRREGETFGEAWGAWSLGGHRPPGGAGIHSSWSGNEGSLEHPAGRCQARQGVSLDDFSFFLSCGVRCPHGPEWAWEEVKGEKT